LLKVLVGNVFPLEDAAVRAAHRNQILVIKREPAVCDQRRVPRVALVLAPLVRGWKPVESDEPKVVCDGQNLPLVRATARIQPDWLPEFRCQPHYAPAVDAGPCSPLDPRQRLFAVDLFKHAQSVPILMLAICIVGLDEVPVGAPVEMREASAGLGARGPDEVKVHERIVDVQRSV
jgi:hypothetical protein